MIEAGLVHIGRYTVGFEFIMLSTIVAIAAFCDIKSRRIPNSLIVASLFFGFFYQTISGYGHGFGFWAWGICVGLISFLPLYIIRAMGAGDVKLMAAVGGFIGGAGAFQTVLLTLLAGGTLALLVMVWNRNWKLVFENIGLITASMTIAAMTRQLPKAEAPVKSAGSLPYGVAIAAGTLLYICFFRP